MSGIVGTSSSKSKLINFTVDTAAAWARFNGNTPALLQSFNISTLDDLGGTGNWRLNFTNPMRTGNFCVVACSSQSMELVGTTASASVTIETRNGDNNASDTDKISVAVFI